MSSLQTSFKQTNGYFVAVNTTAFLAYTISAAESSNGGSYVPVVLTAASVTPAAGDVFKDMGKTVTTGAAGTTTAANVVTGGKVNGVGPRVFRKVQRLNKFTDATKNLVANGISGVPPNAVTGDTGFNTFYIELPVSGGAAPTPQLVYVPGMPGLGY